MKAFSNAPRCPTFTIFGEIQKNLFFLVFKHVAQVILFFSNFSSNFSPDPSKCSLKRYFLYLQNQKFFPSPNHGGQPWVNYVLHWDIFLLGLNIPEVFEIQEKGNMPHIQ